MVERTPQPAQNDKDERWPLEEPGDGREGHTESPSRSPKCRAAGSCGQPAHTCDGRNKGTRAKRPEAAERGTGAVGGWVRPPGADRQPPPAQRTSGAQRPPRGCGRPTAGQQSRPSGGVSQTDG